MTVLYVGKSNTLAAQISDSFRKEGNDVYLLTDKDFVKENKPALAYKVYVAAGSYSDTEKYFVNIKPEIVIFSGGIYLMEDWRQEERTGVFLQQLLNILNFSLMSGVKKFILLSSSHVLDGRTGRKEEGAEIHPSDYKGMLYAQAEEMTSLWGRSGEMETVVLRTDLVLGCGAWEENGDLVERMAKSFVSTGSYAAERNRVYTPVAVKDVANAVLRCSAMALSDCYHVAGNEEVSEAELASLVNRAMGGTYLVEEKAAGEGVSYALSNARMKKELEWVPFYRTEAVLSEGSVRYTLERKRRLRGRKGESVFLTVAENILLFLLAAAVSVWGEHNPVFSGIDMMQIYVLLAGLGFGMRQSVPSIIYACAFTILHSYGEQISPMVILTNVETLLQFTVYIFTGVAAGYMVDFYKLKLKEKNTEYEFLQHEYEAVREINDDNFMIKQEYQKRLLEYKTSLPKLYSVISGLSTLEPDQIFSETIRAVKDVMEVETVAVYLAKKGSSYMRLSVSSGENAVFVGKSFNLDDYPQIKKVFEKDEIFIGATRTGKEPALAAPIFYRGDLTAALVIMEAPFSYLSLNYTNLFRTMAVMITTFIVKAKDYEASVRRDLLVPDTEIYYPFEFGKLLSIAREKKNQEIADFCVLSIALPERTERTGEKAESGGAEERSAAGKRMMRSEKERGGYPRNRGSVFRSFRGGSRNSGGIFRGLGGSGSPGGRSRNPQHNARKQGTAAGFPAEEAYFRIANLLRNTDYFGMDDGRRLYVLLGNTAESDAAFVLGRMREKGVDARLVPDEELDGLLLTRHSFGRGGEG